MKLSVNLATRPFIELRPFFLRLRIIMASLALVALALAVVTHSLQKKVDVQQAQLREVKGQTLQVQLERTREERRMQLPQNAAVLERAHLLNSLFLHKSFSWTAVMMDLETVLPVGVQVTTIEPQISGTGELGIRLRVAGDRDRAVQLLRNLEHSQRFLQPRLSTEVSQAKEGQGGNAAAAAAANNPNAPVPGVEFDILAVYNPLPEGQAYPKRKPLPPVVTAGAAHAVSAATPAFDTSGRHGVVLKPYQAPATTAVPAGPRRKP